MMIKNNIFKGVTERESFSTLKYSWLCSSQILCCLSNYVPLVKRHILKILTLLIPIPVTPDSGMFSMFSLQFSDCLKLWSSWDIIASVERVTLRNEVSDSWFMNWALNTLWWYHASSNHFSAHKARKEIQASTEHLKDTELKPPLGTHHCFFLS